MTTLVGNDQFDPTGKCSTPNGALLYFQFTATTTGTADQASIRFLTGEFNIDVRIGVYNTSGVLLGQTGRVTGSPDSELVTGNLLSPVSITSGTVYRLAIVYESNAGFAALTSNIARLSDDGTSTADLDTGLPSDISGVSFSSSSRDTPTIYLSETAAPPATLDTVPATAYPGQSRTLAVSNAGATQGTGGVTIGGVAQTVTSWSDTSITFTTVQGNNKYATGKTIVLTTDGGQTASGTIDLIVEPGTGGYVDVVSPETTDTSAFAYQAETVGGDPVETTDQFAWRYTGDPGDPTSMTVQADTLPSYIDVEGDVEGRFWDATDSTWGAWYMFTAAVEDTAAPTITSVDVPTASFYKAGDVLTFTSNFSESVDVTGTPAINFSVNGSPRQANYSSGTGSSVLVFQYTVQNGDDTNGLSVTSLSLDGGTIEDTAGNAADLTLVSVGDTSGIIIDTVAPTVGVENVTTTNTAPIISGTASGVSQVSVVVNAVTYTPAVSGGTWSQQLPTLAVNDYPVTVDATDDAGNTAVQAQATLSIVEAGSGFIVAKANASGNSLWGSIGMPEGALVSLVDDDSGAVTLNSEGIMECSKNASVATLDVDGSSVKVLVRPVGTPIKPFYKVNWQILD